MRWVRVHSHFDVWASNGPAPTFCITSDNDGEAFLEIAKYPELLFRPVSDPSDMWNCFFTHTGSNDGSVAATTITITGGHAEYTLPDAVWAQMKNVAGESTRGALYYRVKARPTGSSSEGYTSHTDTACQDRNVPSIEITPVAGTPTAAFDDSEALGHLTSWEQMFIFLFPLMGDDPEHRALQTMVAHPVYRDQSSSRIRAKMLQLFIRSGGEGRQLFERLLDLRVAVGSSAGGGHMTEPALFWRDERSEGTTLDHLLALWDVQLDPRVPLLPSKVIFEAIVELIDPPGQINQGAAGTCAATSIQTYTALRNPAEYARWCRYILDRRQNHTVTLANGGTMRANPEAFDVATWRTTQPAAGANWQLVIGRTYSERGIQAALMQYAHTGAGSYDPERDSFVTWLGTALGSGLQLPEVKRALDAIFNQSWTWDFGGGTSASAPNAGAATNVMSHFQNHGLPVYISILWGTGGHGVLGLRVENNRLIFRNPQYRGSYPPSAAHVNGAAMVSPTRTIHNVSRSEESMDLAGLQAAIRGFCHE